MIIRRALGLLVSILLIAAPRTAFAHAHLVKSAPTAGARIGTVPHVIQLWFSEAPEAALTVITLTAANGQAIPLGMMTAAPNTPVSVMVAIDGALAPGDYTVTWRTVAADDGHPSNGNFSFTVTEVAGAAAATTAQLRGPAAAVPEALNTGPKAGLRSGMDVESPVYVIIRWMSFTAIVLLIGVIVFRVLVLPRVGASDSAFAQASMHEVLSGTMIPGLATLGLLAGLMVAIAAIGRLFAEQAVMAASMSMGLADIVLHMTWGSAWLLQIGAAVVACAGFALARGRLAIG